MANKPQAAKSADDTIEATAVEPATTTDATQTPRPFADYAHVWRAVTDTDKLSELATTRANGDYVLNVGAMGPGQKDKRKMLYSVVLDWSGVTRDQIIEIASDPVIKWIVDNARTAADGSFDKLKALKFEHEVKALDYVNRPKRGAASLDQELISIAARGRAAGLTEKEIFAKISAVFELAARAEA